jgi:hypothetical protein
MLRRLVWIRFLVHRPIKGVRTSLLGSCGGKMDPRAPARTKR